MNGVISGRVVDETGALVSGAIVAITSGPGPVSDIASLTDAEGRFRRGGLAPGSYTLAVHKAGHAPHIVNVDLAAGQSPNVEIRLGD